LQKIGVFLTKLKIYHLGRLLGDEIGPKMKSTPSLMFRSAGKGGLFAQLWRI